MNRAAIATTITAMMVILGSSCQGGPEWSADTEGGDEGFQSLRARQFLRVSEEGSSALDEWDVGFVDGAPSGAQSTQFKDLILDQCERELAAGSTVCGAGPSDIATALCSPYKRLCAAYALEEIAGLSAEPFRLEDVPGARVYLIPAQSTPTNAALHEWAAYLGREASVTLIEILEWSAGIRPWSEVQIDVTVSPAPADIAGTFNNGVEDVSYASAATMALVDSSNLVDEAVHNAVRENLAAADGHYSREPTLAGAVELATSAPVLSRAHAAHLLVGGAPGLAGLLDPADRGSGDEALHVALCTQPQLSPQAHAAMAYIRDAAIAPSVLLSEAVDTDTLLAAHIAPRIVTLYGLESTILGTTAEQFAEAVNLDVADFREARAVLIEQHRAFARTNASIYLPDRVLPSGVVYDQRYAATGADPRPPVPEYYAAAARYDTSISGHLSFPQRDEAGRSLSHYLDYVYTSIARINRFSEGLPLAIREEVLDPLGTLYGSASGSRPGRLVSLRDPIAAGNMLPAPAHQTWTGAESATAAGGNPDPAGAGNAWMLSDGHAGKTGLAHTTSVPVSSDALFAELWVQQFTDGSDPTVAIDIELSDARSFRFLLRPETGESLAESTTVLQFSSPVSGWWRILIKASLGSVPPVGTTARLVVRPAAGYGSSFPMVSPLPLGAVNVYAPMLSDGILPGDDGDIVYLHDGEHPAADYLAVAGHDALSCAVRGAAEGVSCNWSDVAANIRAHVDDVEASSASGFNRALGFGSFAADSMVFVVRRRPGASALTPGAYEPVVGAWSGAVGSHYPLAPAVPHLSREAAAILTPSASWCAQPRLSCAGVEFDARLPLENELSEDAHARESSWRYWLALARQAADQADALGQQVIEEGLQNDLRAEAAAARLHSLCGGSVDLRGLLDSDLSEGSAGVCSTGADCAADHICSGGRCLLAPIRALQQLAAAEPPNPGAARLLECLNGDVVVPFVAVGARPVCLWTKIGNPNIICEGAAPGQCPVVVDTPDCSHLAAPGGTNNEWIYVEDRLGYFESDAPGASRPVREPPCDAIRSLRDPAREIDLPMAEELFNGFFDPFALRATAEQIGVYPLAEGFGYLTVGGEPFGPQMGDPFTGPAAGLPCNSTDDSEPLCSSDAASPFACRIASCADWSLREAYFMRLREAALTARYMTSAYSTAGLWFYSHPGIDYAPAEAGSPRVFRITSDGVQLIQTDVLLSEIGDPVGPGEVGVYTRRQYCTVDGTGGSRDELWAPHCSEGARRSTVFNHDQNTPLADWDVINDRFFEGMGVVPLPEGRHYEFEGTTSLLQFLLDGRRDAESRHRIPGPSALAQQPEWRYLAAQQSHTSSEIFDALELLCEAASVSNDACPPTPPSVAGVDDLSSAVRYMSCGADEIHRGAERVVLRNVPHRALDALRDTSPVGAVPAAGGQYGEGLTELRSHFVSLTLAPSLIAAEIHGLASDLNLLRVSLATLENARELAELQYWSTMSVELTNCLSSALSSDWTNPQSFGVGILTCANSIVQIGLADRVRDIEDENAALGRQGELARFQERFSSRVATIRQLATGVSTSLESIDGALARLEQTRAEARLALSQALLLDSDQSDVYARANSAMRRRQNLSRVRYDRARGDAVRLAYMAKRAVEQRLGVRLATMTHDMALVEAPNRWEARLCELEGIDYERLRDETELPVSAVADEFIGDYLTRLERVVESYQIDHPFSDGEDTAVISLRDDLHQTRAWCETPNANLLAHAAELDALVNSHTGEFAWEPSGCRVTSGETEPNCVSLARLSPGDRTVIAPFTVVHPEYSDNLAYRVFFGHPSGDTCGATGDCGLTSATRWFQRVPVAPGRYRLSWYGATATGSTLDPAGVVRAVDDAGTVIAGTTAPASSTTGLTGNWTRYWRVFDVPEGVDALEVELVPDVAMGVASQAVDIGGVMLENVSAEVFSGTMMYAAANHPPGIFQATNGAGTRMTPSCEDTAGTEFRRRWTRNCVRLCADGFGADCSEGGGEEYCYWETSFGLTQRDIERGRVLSSAGFARGNYNYRLGTVAANIVGTGVRDCERSRSPSACYTGGYLQYSIEHLGPHTVRNVRGEDYVSELFNGRVEHARALASERYVSNPLSSSDRTLLSDYYRRELVGRPLDGTYVVRIWDTPGLAFDRIEDVQLVVNYSYWTRLH